MLEGVTAAAEAGRANVIETSSPAEGIVRLGADVPFRRMSPERSRFWRYVRLSVLYRDARSLSRRVGGVAASLKVSVVPYGGSSCGGSVAQRRGRRLRSRGGTNSGGRVRKAALGRLRILALAQLLSSSKTS